MLNTKVQNSIIFKWLYPFHLYYFNVAWSKLYYFSLFDYICNTTHTAYLITFFYTWGNPHGPVPRSSEKRRCSVELYWLKPHGGPPDAQLGCPWDAPGLLSNWCHSIPASSLVWVSRSLVSSGIGRDHLSQRHPLSRRASLRRSRSSLAYRPLWPPRTM